MSNKMTATRKLSNDFVLKRIMASTALPNIAQSECIFKNLVRTLISQQLSTKAAASIYQRFLNLMPNENFKAINVLNQTPEALRSCGLSNQKTKYITNAAAYFKDKDTNVKYWSTLPESKVYDELTSIKGVGPWTAKIILMFTLRNEDIFPSNDLTIKNAIVELYDLDKDAKYLEKKLIEIAEKWRPFRSVASRYLWAWKDQKK